MKEPTFDQHGYPTEETLQAIREWPYEDRHGLVIFLKQAWNFEYGSMATRVWGGQQGLYIVTGGWSGNEDVVAALQQNTLFWTTCWEMSKRGGKHCFHVPPVTPSSSST